jgi:hypothetical protein
MWSYVERNYGVINYIHGFYKEKERGEFFVNEHVKFVAPCMIHKIRSLTMINKTMDFWD